MPNLGDLSNSPNAVAYQDSIPPAAIILTANAGSATGTSDLTWTAPDDDGDTGAAADYLVRYNDAVI